MSKFNNLASNDLTQFLVKDRNLSDLESIEESLINLGVSVNQVYATDALLKQNNLSDITNAQQARTNLGLPSIISDIGAIQLAQINNNNTTLNLSGLLDGIIDLTNGHTTEIAEIQNKNVDHKELLDSHATFHIAHDSKFSDNDALWQLAINHFDNILPKMATIDIHTDQIASIITINNTQQNDIKDALDDIKILQESNIGDLSNLTTLVNDHTSDISLINNTLVQYENRIDTLENAPPPNDYDDTKLISDIKINTDDIILINVGIGSINTSLGTINTANSSQDSKILAIEQKNALQDSSILNNANEITSASNSITTLDALQSGYFKTDGSRQITNDVVFNGGTRYIKSLDKNLIQLNYSDGTVSFPSLTTDKLVRSIGGKLINSQLSANDIDPSSITDGKLQTSYLPIDGSKQITGNLSFNNTIKSINNFSELNLISNGLTPSNVKVNGSGVLISASNFTLSNFDGAVAYSIPTSRGGLNQILKLDINNNMQWTDLPAATDISGKVTKNGDIGNIVIGSTDGNLSLLQNNTTFFNKNNTNLTISTPTTITQQLTLNNYTMPLAGGVNGQILRINGNQLAFDDETVAPIVSLVREFYKLTNQADYTMNLTPISTNIPIFSPGITTEDISSNLLISDGSYFVNNSPYTKYFKINLVLSYSAIPDLNYVFAILVDDNLITSTNPTSVIGVEVNSNYVTVQSGSSISFSAAKVGGNGTITILTTFVSISEVEILPALKVGYDNTNSYSFPQFASNIPDDSILKYNSSLKSYEPNRVSIQSFAQVFPTLLTVQHPANSQTFPAITWQLLLTNTTGTITTTASGLNANINTEYLTQLITARSLTWPHVRIKKTGWYRIDYSVQMVCRQNATYFLTSIGKLVGAEVPTKITESLGGDAQTVPTSGHVNMLTASCNIFCTENELYGILFFYRRSGATATLTTSDTHDIVSYSFQIEFLR